MHLLSSALWAVFILCLVQNIDGTPVPADSERAGVRSTEQAVRGASVPIEQKASDTVNLTILFSSCTLLNEQSKDTAIIDFTVQVRTEGQVPEDISNTIITVCDMALDKLDGKKKRVIEIKPNAIINQDVSIVRGHYSFKLKAVMGQGKPSQSCPYLNPCVVDFRCISDVSGTWVVKSAVTNKQFVHLVNPPMEPETMQVGSLNHFVFGGVSDELGELYAKVLTIWVGPWMGSQRPEILNPIVNPPVFGHLVRLFFRFTDFRYRDVWTVMSHSEKKTLKLKRKTLEVLESLQPHATGSSS
ncbi:hypothetical protein C8R42DRAFT_638824 [Lentinula raphanica]|nr:hypothetical protein C8R42DRAFT_638824 [Lentinula raphanica]